MSQRTNKNPAQVPILESILLTILQIHLLKIHHRTIPLMYHTFLLQMITQDLIPQLIESEDQITT